MNKKQRFAIGPILFLHTLSWGAAIGGFALTWEAGRRIIQGVWDTDDALLYGLVGVPLGLCSWGSISLVGGTVIKWLYWACTGYGGDVEVAVAANKMGISPNEVRQLMKDGELEAGSYGRVAKASIKAYMARCDKERNAK